MLESSPSPRKQSAEESAHAGREQAAAEVISRKTNEFRLREIQVDVLCQ